MFKKAIKQEAKLRLAIAGPSGSGKTYTALSVGTSLGRVAFADTEHGSASKYADLFDFDVVNMEPPFHPDKFVEVIQAAANMGYDVIIIDSLSHAWNGSGGALELVEQFSRKYKGNSYAAWGDVTPIQNRLIEAIVSTDIHIIATMRAKQDYILIERNGKQVPQKVGMAPIQRDGTEYEFDVLLDMDIENNAIVNKTRCPALQGKVVSRPGSDLAGILRDWLSGEPAPAPKTAAAIEAEVKAANTLTEWATATYQLQDVGNAFENAGRVADWYKYAVGDFDKSHNGKVLTALRVYTNAIADGASKSSAASRSKAKFVELTQPAEPEGDDVANEEMVTDLFGEQRAAPVVAGAYQE